jgi:hypothetical protein
MPTTILCKSDLPARIAECLRVDPDGAVTILAGAKVATFDGDTTVDRNMTYARDEPIPFSIIDGIQVMEARKGGLLAIAAESRAIILEAAGVAMLLVYSRDTGEWQIHCRSPLSQAMSVLLSHRFRYE